MMKVSAILLGLTANAMGDKQVIFVAGPRRSDGTGVSLFFQQHASGNTSENGLDGWLWPQTDDELPGEKHRSFENFFWNSYNDTIQDILMQSIQDAWEEAEHGIILGADGFDNTRGSLDSIGLRTMHRILDTLDVPPQQVTVVMLYKSPRLDQWVDLYHHNADQGYEYFICKEDYTEHLANIPMNPFMVASAYREQGWRVATVDVVGTHQNGSDVTHAVACQVLPNTTCEDDRILNLQDEYTKEDSIDLGEFTSLPRSKQNELEGLFQSRDCFYQESLESDQGFSIVHKTTVWMKCGRTDVERERYNALTDSEHFFDLVKDQMGCSKSGQTALQPTFDDVPAESGKDEEENIEVESSSSLNDKQLTLLLAALVIALFLTYQFIARCKRRQTGYVRSPTGQAVWKGFTDDGSNAENLRGSTGVDGIFSDVDLASPPVPKSAKNQASVAAGSEDMTGNHTMAAAAKEGRSVRGMYRVGLYQDDPPTAESEPQGGDSELEFQIKSLEKEFA